MNNQNKNVFPPNIDPQVYAWIACVVGSACAVGYNANEQNSFGNWLILVGQFILTTAAQQQLINGRNNVHNTGATWGTNTGSNNSDDQINFLIEAVRNLQKELENLKSQK